MMIKSSIIIPLLNAYLAFAAAALANKEDADARSIFVGNVLFFLAQAMIEPLALCVLCTDLEGLVCPL
jgi:hypothetical protein